MISLYSVHCGRVVVAQGNYYENIVFSYDSSIEAAESAKGKVTLIYKSNQKDIPAIDIKVTISLSCVD